MLKLVGKKPLISNYCHKYNKRLYIESCHFVHKLSINIVLRTLFELYEFTEYRSF